MRPLLSGRVLGERGPRNQQPVVAHPEDLIADGQQPACHHDQNASPPAGCGDQHHHQRQTADQRQFRAHQHGQTGDERQRRGEAAACRLNLLRPAHHHPPQQAEIGQHQTVFEPGGGEVAGRWQRDVDERTGRQQQRASAEQARRIQPRRTQHHEDHTQHRQHQRQRQRHVLQPHRAADDAAHVHQVGPQRRGVGLHALARVEHRAVAGQQVSHRAQHDQPVVGDPAPLPRTPAEQRSGDQHTDPEADPSAQFEPAPAIRRRRPHRLFRSMPTQGTAARGRAARSPPARRPSRCRRPPRSAGSRS